MEMKVTKSYLLSIEGEQNGKTSRPNELKGHFPQAFSVSDPTAFTGLVSGSALVHS
jgi:hypothetical protein